MSQSVCKEIQCPYFGSDSRNYGCQRYSISTQCHLFLAHRTEFSSSEYELFADEPSEGDIAGWKNGNDAFFLEDEMYSRDIKFKNENADWFEGSSFVVKEISK